MTVLSTSVSRGAGAVDGDPGGRGSTPVCGAARDKNAEASDADSFSAMGTDMQVMQVMQGPTGARRSSWGLVGQESSLNSGAA